MMRRRSLLGAALAAAARPASAQAGPLRLGVGLFQPDRERNDATYRPLAQHLSRRLSRPVELRTVDTWEGLAKSLANGETDGATCWPTTLPVRRRWRPSCTTASPSTSRSSSPTPSRGSPT
jgi:phosphonate transport system substrate-binding protein